MNRRTRIKICGLCDPAVAKQAIELGAQYVGIMCYSKSRRYVDCQLGKEIASAVKTAGGIPVAVFVDADVDRMLALCETMGVDVVQLHGSIARQSQHKLPRYFQRIYVVHVAVDGTIQPDADNGLSELVFSRDFLMYDGITGGSGKRFELDTFMNPFPMPFFLAGGLDPQNVGAAIQALHPYAVDVSTGVESAPGIKDIEKIAAFIESVNRVNRG